MSAHTTVGEFAAVGGGAAVGAWLRWGLGLMLNSVFPLVPPGTLAANLLGGFLMGLALGLMHSWPGLPPAMKLFVTTGFLGGLTTFSTFSAEAFHLMQRQEWSWFAGMVAIHVAGSLAMTWLGHTLFNLLKGAA